MSKLVVESFEVGSLTVKIHIDEDPQSPRDWDNFGTMVCWHSRYNLGDEQLKEDPTDFLESLPEGSIILPLYLYDHSGITMSCAGFSCPWDSGQVGYIYATPDRIRKEYGCKRITKKIREKAESLLRGEVSTYDEFIRGDVYGYTVEDENGEELDSCWGFFGREYVEQEARSVAEGYAEVSQAQEEYAGIPCGAD